MHLTSTDVASLPSNRARFLLAGWASCLLALAAIWSVGAQEASGAMYWGGIIKGSVYGVAGEDANADAPRNRAVLSRFEQDAGKQITVVNTGQAWATFDPVTMDAAIEAGAIPLVTMALEGQTLREVAEGHEDAKIRAWAREAKAFGYPFLFRPWWEMNGNWYSWGRSPYYVAAWRHFHDVVEEVGATNVTWAWVVNTIWWDPGSDPAPYYPGSAYVDWVGMDAYNWGTNPLQPNYWTSPAETIDPTLAALERIAPGKPVCLCEVASTGVGGDKAAWISQLLGSYLPSHPSIAAFLWFNWYYEQNGGSWDWPIESSSGAERAFQEGIQNDLYLSALPPLQKLAKVPLLAGQPSAVGNGKKQPAKGRVVFVKLRLNRRAGSAELRFRVPGAGAVELSGSGIRLRLKSDRNKDWSKLLSPPVRRGVREAGRLSIELRASGKARDALLRRGRVKVRLVLTFLPRSGSPQRAMKNVALVVAPPRSTAAG